jgi:hypothetical protein
MTKKHFLTVFSLIAFGLLTIPLNAQWSDTDGDGARDDWEVQNGSDPLSTASFPKPASKKVTVKAFTNIEESGISPNKTADSSGQRNRWWRGEDVIWSGIVEAFPRT